MTARVQRDSMNSRSTEFAEPSAHYRFLTREETREKASAVIGIAAFSITIPGAITSPQRVLAGETLLPPAETAAPQAVVARDRLPQRVRCVTHRAPSGSSGAWSDLGVWWMVRPSQASLAIRASLTGGANGRSLGRAAAKDWSERVGLLIA